MARPRPPLPGQASDEAPDAEARRQETPSHTDPEPGASAGTDTRAGEASLVHPLELRAPDRGGEQESGDGQAEAVSGLPADTGELDPIRFPGSIAESNQGPDPRYYPGVVDPAFEDADAEIAIPDRPRFGPRDEPQFLYLAGDAGTGKSYTVRQRAENYRDAILLATTGIAAVNLGGTTINSALRYYDSASMQLEYEFGRLGVALRQLYQSGIRRLCIDEISMMDGRQLDILCLAVDELNERLREEDRPKDENDPGQMGITLTGDHAQLPPVGVDRKKDHDGTIYPFKAVNWSRFAENTQTLTTMHRQADPAFLTAIQQLRKGDKNCVPYFKQFIVQGELTNFEGSTILATNAEVDRYNKVRMMRLTGPERYYSSTRTGEPKDQPSEWKHIPEILTLKNEAMVMILANGYDELRELIYANGDLGHYLDPEEDDLAGFARVRLIRTGEVVFVGRVMRERLKPGVARFVKPGKQRNPDHVLATIDYMPLRVAYATTVHKVQGLSLDAIQLMINSQFWLSSGMMYVGVSRVRTPQGLRIVGTVDQFAARVRANPNVKEWL